jgi:glutamine synthetase
LSTDQILQEVANSPHDRVKLVASDIDGVPRGKIVNKEKFFSAAKGGLAFCSVVFGWDCGGKN